MLFCNRRRARVLLGASAAAAALAFADFATADTIGFNFGTSSGTATSTSGTASNWSAGSFTIGNSFGSVPVPISTTSSSTTYSGASGGYNIGNAVAKGGTLNTATSAYYQITLTASAGYNLVLNDFDFGTRSTGTGPTAFSLYYSTDGFGTSTSITGGTGSINNNSSWAYVNSATTFSGITISAGSTLTLRLYTYGYTGVTNPSSGTINNRIDDVSITASALAVGGGGPSIVFFDTNNSASGVGGSGNWDTTSNNWSSVSTGDIATSTYAGNVPVVFDGTPGNVTVAAGGVSVGGGTLSINSAGYVFSGGAISLSGSGANIVTGNNGATTISSAITGSALTKTGAGTLVLANSSNTFASLIINGGTIQAGSDGALGAGQVNFNSGTLAATSNITSAKSFVGSGSIDTGGNAITIGDATFTALNLTGGGSFTFNGVKTDLGNLTIAVPTAITAPAAGLIKATAVNYTGTGTQAIATPVSITGSTMVVGAAEGSTLSFGSVLNSTATLAKTIGTGTLALTGASSDFRVLRIGVSGTAPVTGGTVSFDSAGALGAGVGATVSAGIQFNSGTLNNASGGTVTIQKALSFGDGGSGVTFSGGDMVFDTSAAPTLTAASFFHSSGVTTPVGITVNNNVTLANGFGGTGTNGGVSISSLNLSGSGSLTFGGTSNLVTPINVSGATMAVTGSLTSTLASVSLTSGATLKGTGTIAASVTAVSGTVALGHSGGALTVGDVNLESGGSFSVDLNVDGSGDKLIVTGIGLLGGTLTGTATGDFTMGQTFTVIDGQNAGLTGQFAGLAEGASVLLSGKEFTVSYLNDDGGDVSLIAVPEPSTLSLLALGGLGLLRRRRRA